MLAEYVTYKFWYMYKHIAESCCLCCVTGEFVVVEQGVWTW